MLKEVILTKRDTCVSYVMRRIGKDKLVDITYDELLKYVVTNPGDHKIGDVILYDEKVRSVPYANKIDGTGRIYTLYLKEGFHVGVIESINPPVISDAFMNDSNLFQQIRLRELFKPNYKVLRFYK